MKRKRKGVKIDGKDLLSVPGMESLDQLTRDVLQVPKEEVDRREQAAKRQKSNESADKEL